MVQQSNKLSFCFLCEQLCLLLDTCTQFDHICTAVFVLQTSQSGRASCLRLESYLLWMMMSFTLGMEQYFLYNVLPQVQAPIWLNKKHCWKPPWPPPGIHTGRVTRGNEKNGYLHYLHSAASAAPCVNIRNTPGYNRCAAGLSCIRCRHNLQKKTSFYFPCVFCRRSSGGVVPLYSSRSTSRACPLRRRRLRSCRSRSPAASDGTSHWNPLTSRWNPGADWVALPSLSFFGQLTNPISPPPRMSGRLAGLYADQHHLRSWTFLFKERKFVL